MFILFDSHHCSNVQVYKHKKKLHNTTIWCFTRIPLYSAKPTGSLSPGTGWSRRAGGMTLLVGASSRWRRQAAWKRFQQEQQGFPATMTWAEKARRTDGHGAGTGGAFARFFVFSRSLQFRYLLYGEIRLTCGVSPTEQACISRSLIARLWPIWRRQLGSRVMVLKLQGR